MQANQWMFLAVVFAVVGALGALAMALFAPAQLRERLRRMRVRREPAQSQEGAWVEKVAKAAQPFSRLSLPEEGWERSPLRTRFMNAGWRDPAAPTLYFAAKTLLALGLPSVLGLSLAASARQLPGNGFLMLLLGAAACGYYLPNALLSRQINQRQRDIFETIPDALDLLTVCVEAGLSLERALMKVASEIHIKSLVLAQELQLVLMEMRSGFSKDKALRNFALRSGVEDIDTLVAMLVQSERFGTSMGDSLRVHSENLRSKRRLLAEESAAKIGVKLLFPLIFCIFPALLMVLLAPAMINLARTLLPTLTAS